MKQYTVTTTIRWVGPPKGEPTERIHYRGDSLAVAVRVTAACARDIGESGVVETLSVRLDVSEPQPDEVQVEHKQETELLPPDFDVIADQQGWAPGEIIDCLRAFVADDGGNDRLAEFARERADEENQ